MRRFFLTLLCSITCLAVFMAANAREIAVTYPSINQHGDSITLSGMICVPDSKPQGVILIPHYTIMSKYEAPSIKRSLSFSIQSKCVFNAVTCSF